jgi:hypothetical protein
MSETDPEKRVFGESDPQPFPKSSFLFNLSMTHSSPLNDENPPLAPFRKGGGVGN